jgi:ketosteroid isomerase-like protein
MTVSNRQLIETFFDVISKGELPDEVVTPDMTFWSVNSGESGKERFRGGVKVLSSIFGGTLTYIIESLTSQDDRIVAEVRSEGTLTTGEPFQNTHVFIFRTEGGRIAAAREYMNQFVVRDLILPLMQAPPTGSHA